MPSSTHIALQNSTSPPNRHLLLMEKQNAMPLAEPETTRFHILSVCFLLLFFSSPRIKIDRHGNSTHCTGSRSDLIHTGISHHTHTQIHTGKRRRYVNTVNAYDIQIRRHRSPVAMGSSQPHFCYISENVQAQVFSEIMY